MKLFKNVIQSFLCLTLTTILSCTYTTSTSYGLEVETNEIRFGIKENGEFIDREGRVFKPGEKLNIKFPLKGLKVIDATTKFTGDMTVKREGKVLASIKNFMGEDGLTVKVDGVEPDYTGNDGIADVTAFLNLPSDIKTGDMNIEIKLKDLNNTDNTASFSTGFKVKSDEGSGGSKNKESNNEGTGGSKNLGSNNETSSETSEENTDTSEETEAPPTEDQSDSSEQ